MVLKRNEWERKTWRAVEPELKWDVEESRWEGTGRTINTSRGSRGHISNDGTRDLTEHLLALRIRGHGRITDHAAVGDTLAPWERELSPDGEPLAVKLVDLEGTNLNRDGVDHLVAEVTSPRETNGLRVSLSEDDGWEGDLEVHRANQIGRAGDLNRAGAAEIGDTREGELGRLKREDGVGLVRGSEDRVTTIIRDEALIGGTTSDELDDGGGHDNLVY